MFNKIYHIVFNVNGGNNIDDVLCKSGKAFPVLPYATKEGYKFLGWFLDENFENEATFEKMPKKNLVLYAKWEVISLEEFSKDINFFTKSSNILQNLQTLLFQLELFLKLILELTLLFLQRLLKKLF